MSEKKEKGSSTNISSIKRSSDAKADEPAVKKSRDFSMNIKPITIKGNIFSKTVKKPGIASVSLKLQKKEQKTSSSKVIPKSAKTAAIFNDESDSDPEEMPAEARMRMKNVGRDTPTSAGPNSFNKGKLGFVDSQKQWEAKQKQIVSQSSKKS